MTRVKICGIQHVDHAIVAAEAGADLIGLVFVPHRHRRLTVAAAQAIVSGLKTLGGKAPQVVGLFADQPPEEVNHIIQACQLDLVQLCGQESIDYCTQVQARAIKALHVSSPPAPPMPNRGQGEVPPFGTEGQGGISAPEGQSEWGLDIDRLAGQARSYQEAGHLVTLDRQVDGLQGGTGQSFNWEIAAGLSRQGYHFILAGGLTPANVARAIAAVQPWGVDVSSGVETGGVKDPDKIRAFIKNAKGPAL